jgi:large subunit ribosomal protein L28
MSKICQISQKKLMSGNNVSHANNKTKRVFEPNVRAKYLRSKFLGRIRIMLSSSGMRTVEKHGGIDQYLLTQNIKDPLMRKLKTRLQKAITLHQTS